MSPHNVNDRIAYLDNLRTALVILVVLHHASLVYSAIAPFYYQEPPFTDPLAFIVLSVFALTNQAWFMGALFFLAGYFTPGAVDRKGAGAFTASRLVRLGIPLLLALFVLEPLARIGFFLMPAELTGISSPLSWSTYPGMIGIGPMWFVLLLLIFDLVYAAWRLVFGSAKIRVSRVPTATQVIGFTLGLALISSAWRLAVPMGQDAHLFVGTLSFPTLAYLPQYFSLFVIGTIAFQSDWLSKLPVSYGAVGGVAALLATIVLFPLAISGSWFSLTFSPGSEFTGRGTWQSVVYAAWDSVLAVGLLLLALVVFRRSANDSGPASRFLARHSFAVYIIHSVIITFAAYALRNVAIPAFGKFALLALIVLPVSFGLAFVIRKLPLADRVL